jgi:hypothetical protein
MEILPGRGGNQKEAYWLIILCVPRDKQFGARTVEGILARVEVAAQSNPWLRRSHQSGAPFVFVQRSGPNVNRDSHWRYKPSAQRNLSRNGWRGGGLANRARQVTQCEKIDRWPSLITPKVSVVFKPRSHNVLQRRKTELKKKHRG